MSDSERLDRALDDLLAGKSPRVVAKGLDPDEQQMLRFAQLLRGSRSEEPEPEFVESLHERLFPRPHGVSRRTAFLGGITALAAGVIGGLGLDRLGLLSLRMPSEPALVGGNGSWVAVVAEADLPQGAVKAFKAEHVQGYLINHGGTVRALSRICTHMGCQLDFAPSEQAFVCPCHGAEFSLSGKLTYGPGGYGYNVTLPPLPEIKVRQRNGAIEVWSV